VALKIEGEANLRHLPKQGRPKAGWDREVGKGGVQFSMANVVESTK
jgi:hypothetical protein